MTNTRSEKIIPQDLAYCLSSDSVVESLGTNPEGLTPKEVRKRRRKYGPNTLKQRRPVSRWRIFLRQLQSSVVVLLAVAAVAAFAFGEMVEGGAIIAVLAINTLIGFLMELSGLRSMEELFKMEHIQAKVLRWGRIHKIPAQQLVPGDIVLVEEGDRLAADMRVLETARLQSDESALTGESLPCAKQTKAVSESTPLAERKSMLYKGCMVTGGSGKAVVTATGMDTELGKITALVEEAKEEVTPLEKRLTALSTQLIGIILLISATITIVGILRDYPIFLMVEVGIALAVAAIPEGLPIVATIALSRGLMRMARRNGLVRELSAVETLGSTTIICTDKTGTLTENKMVATQLIHCSNEVKRHNDGTWPKETLTEDSEVFSLLRAATLCNSATYDGVEVDGEPTEAALLTACQEIGLNIVSLRDQYPELRREPFNSTIKMMATYHKSPDESVLVTVKGAPEALFQQSLEEPDRPKWEKKISSLPPKDFECWHLRKRKSIIPMNPLMSS